uniref:Uncharacterized protein n=1 Tax=Rhizophora mucronata TaxID=61149 RepID=A0A2P2ITT6_RHIMU
MMMMMIRMESES